MIENSILRILFSPKPSVTVATLLLVFGGSVVVGIRGWFGPLDVSWIDRLSRHAVFLAGPAIEIDELAPFRTKWSPRIIFPHNGLSARRTRPHEPKVRRKNSKVKAGKYENRNHEGQIGLLMNLVVFHGVE